LSGDLFERGARRGQSREGHVAGGAADGLEVYVVGAEPGRPSPGCR
jgi:hypothetical protein